MKNPSNFKHQESVIKKFLRNFGVWCPMYQQFLHHHFSPRLKFIPPSPFSQSVYSLLSICSFIVLQSLRVVFYILSFLRSHFTTAHFLARSSCTLTVDISPGHRIPRCLRIPSCLDILGYMYTNVHVQSHRPQCVLNDISRLKF